MKRGKGGCVCIHTNLKAGKSPFAKEGFQAQLKTDVVEKINNKM